MTYSIVTEGLVKRFGETRALDGIGGSPGAGPPVRPRGPPPADRRAASWSARTPPGQAHRASRPARAQFCPTSRGQRVPPLAGYAPVATGWAIQLDQEPT